MGFEETAEVRGVAAAGGAAFRGGQVGGGVLPDQGVDGVPARGGEPEHAVVDQAYQDVRGGRGDLDGRFQRAPAAEHRQRRERRLPLLIQQPPRRLEHRPHAGVPGTGGGAGHGEQAEAGAQQPGQLRAGHGPQQAGRQLDGQRQTAGGGADRGHPRRLPLRVERGLRGPRAGGEQRLRRVRRQLPYGDRRLPRQLGPPPAGDQDPHGRSGLQDSADHRVEGGQLLKVVEHQQERPLPS
ncbi:hypothetical protein GCM10020001_041210 [Nonomuraea salmonea]